MKDIAKLISVLTIICLLSGSMLAFVNDLTKDRISELSIQKELALLNEVLPEYDNNPAENTSVISENNIEYKFFVARLNNAYNGVAFKAASRKGFGGEVGIMIGIKPDGTISAVKVTDNKESPEQGKAIAGENFIQQFIAKGIENTIWKLRKDKGDIDGVTQATISSRAVVDAVNTARDVYLRNIEAIKATSAK